MTTNHDEEYVRIWTRCITCGKESPGREAPISLVNKLEGMGQKVRPGIGYCPDCQKLQTMHPYWDGGAYG